MKCKKCKNYIPDYSNECYFCRLNKMKLIYVLLFILSLISLSILGIPEYILSIQGEEFIFTWLKYALTLSILAFIVIIIFAKYFLNKHFDKLINIPYTVNDLLFINDIGDYWYVAYCIIKLKIDWIITYKRIISKSEYTQTFGIKLNDEVTYHDLEDYRKIIVSWSPLLIFLSNLISQKKTLLWAPKIFSII